MFQHGDNCGAEAGAMCTNKFGRLGEAEPTYKSLVDTCRAFCSCGVFLPLLRHVDDVRGVLESGLANSPRDLPPCNVNACRK